MNQPSADLVHTLYTAETVLKAVFIPMALFGLPYSILVGCLASLIALYRVLKTFQVSREFLTRVVTNNHGQNLLYLTLGLMGSCNMLFFAPIMLFFGFGLVEFAKIRYPQSKYSHYVEEIRNDRQAIMDCKGKL